MSGNNARLGCHLAVSVLALFGLNGCDRPSMPIRKSTTAQVPASPAKKVTRKKSPDKKVNARRVEADRAATLQEDVFSAPVSPPESPPVKVALGAEEARELDSLLKWCSAVERDHEEKPSYCRQRPVCLMVMGADPDLHDLVIYSLQATEAQQLCNWDVTLLLYRTGDEVHDLDNLRLLRLEIEGINRRIAAHQEQLASKAQPDTAPLRPLQAPLLYTNKEELERLITGWLAMNFAPKRSASDHKSAPSDSRPPFGNIWFHGHGRTRVDTDRMSPQFSVNQDSWLDILAIEKSIMHRFQAPVWINLDLCRNKIKGKVQEPNIFSRDAGELESREYQNLSEFDMATQEFINELENQRSQLTAGYLIAATPAEAGVTKLFPTNKTVSIDNSYGSLLATATSKLLKQATASSDSSRLVFENSQLEANTLTLRQQMEYTHDFFRQQNVQSVQEPLLSPGTISDQLVVYSTQSMAYSPQYVNLLRGGVAKSAGGFYCRELDSLFSSYSDSITITRPSEQAGGYLNYLFRFQDPVILDLTVPYQLVLLVSGESTAENDSLSFVTGVYSYGGDPSGSTREVLNSSFANYGGAESYRSPVPCDGSIKVLHTTLDKLVDVANSDGQCEVSEIEVQAVPSSPELWPEGAALKIYGAFLLPENVTDEDLNAELQRAQAAPTLREMTYWMLPFHRNPESVLVRLTDSNDTRLAQAEEDYKGTWGVAGQIYPKQFVSSLSRQIRLKVRADEEVDAEAEILVVVNDGGRIIAAWRSSLQAVVNQEIAIDFDSDGIAEEIMIGIRNYPGDLFIESLTLEKRPSGIE